MSTLHSLTITLVAICLSAGCSQGIGEASAVTTASLGGAKVSLTMTRANLEAIAKGMEVARVRDAVHMGRPGFRFDSPQATWFVSKDNQALDGVRFFMPDERPSDAASLASKEAIPGRPSTFESGESKCSVWKKDGYIRIVLVRKLHFGRIVQVLVLSERASLEILGYAGADASEYLRILPAKYGDPSR